MFERIKARRALYEKVSREMAMVEERDRMLKALVKQPLSYEIIRDLVNAAMHDMAVEITLSDQTKILIKRDEPYDKLKRASYGDLF
jgi:hypothetical protein